MITLKNNKGEVIILPRFATIETLVEMGVDKMRFAKHGEPLPDGWWVATEGSKKLLT